MQRPRYNSYITDGKHRLSTIQAADPKKIKLARRPTAPSIAAVARALQSPGQQPHQRIALRIPTQLPLTTRIPKIPRVLPVARKGRLHRQHQVPQLRTGTRFLQYLIHRKGLPRADTGQTVRHRGHPLPRKFVPPAQRTRRLREIVPQRRLFQTHRRPHLHGSRRQGQSMAQSRSLSMPPRCPLRKCKER